MERRTKRILAIVLVAIIGTASGITIWLVLRPYQWSAADCPGVTHLDIPPERIIKIGVIGDLNRIQGEGQKNGAWLRAYEINTHGGIDIGGTTYYIGITAENSDEANPILDTSIGVAAAQRLIDYKQVQFATGGFRTEALLAYRDFFMERKIIFMNTGAATSTFCKNVSNNYPVYKYFFQPNPINTTSLAKELITLIMGTAYVLSLPVPFGTGHNVTRFSFMREALTWTEDFRNAMVAVLTNLTGTNPLFEMDYTGTDIAFPQDVQPAQLNTYWQWIENNNTQIVIPIISGVAGLPFVNTYADNTPHCIPIGINVEAQAGDFWTRTGGKCEYGVTLESVFKTNKTEKTLKFWNNYIGNHTNFGSPTPISPIYTATGSYDAVNQLAWAIETAQSLNPDTIVSTLETLNRTNYLVGAGGWGSYDPSHCITEGWPYGTALAIQWYSGNKTMVPGPGIYPSGLGIISPYPLQNMSPLQLPSGGLYYYD
ncbi:MAG: ABC transporter substrate-binding protein [Promethearchaeota archaeon]